MTPSADITALPRAHLAGNDLQALPYVRFASALLFDGASPADLAGFGHADLFDELMAEFPAISRHDAFLGVTIAWSLIKADMVASLLHAQHLERQLDHRVAA